jgi:gluconate 2-dehydrogenase gamma chain
MTPGEAVELGAVVDQIIPPDETPGATETGVVYFIDLALGGFMAGVAPTLRQGLEDLGQKAQSARAQGSRFSELSFEQQTAVLKEVEDSRFFGTLHFLTMLGMFCLPQYAGNRDNAGWDLLGFDHRHAWQPPFGYYDAAIRGQTMKEGDNHGHG